MEILRTVLQHVQSFKNESSFGKHELRIEHSQNPRGTGVLMGTRRVYQTDGGYGMGMLEHAGMEEGAQKLRKERRLSHALKSNTIENSVETRSAKTP